MKIIDLENCHFNTYIKCLEDWSEEMNEAGSKKSEWYEKFKEKGLKVKLAVENEKVLGMIQYIPIENSYVEGKDLYFIYCIWVHGYKEGIGNHQHKGIGKALLQVVEDDVREMGSKGIVAWGIALPFWMRASWFKKQGFKSVDKDGIARLMWKPFTDDAEKPQWLDQQKKPEIEKGKVVVTSLIHGWCPAQNLSHERAKKAAAEMGTQVIFREIDTSETDTLNEWGVVDALYINKKRINTGPPPTYEKIKTRIAKELKKQKKPPLPRV